MTTVLRLLIGLLMPLSVMGQASSPPPYPPVSDSLVRGTPRVSIPKHLLKAGLTLPLFEQSSVVVRWWTLGTDLTLERKLVQGLTLTAGLTTHFSFGLHAQLYTLTAPLGLRYYFSLGKRMKQRADRHSFFSSYLGLQMHNSLLANLRYRSEAGSGSVLTAATYYRGQMVRDQTNGGNLTEWFNLSQYGYTVVGWQWRVSTANYVDVSVVVPLTALTYHKTPFTLATPALVTLKYGLFW